MKTITDQAIHFIDRNHHMGTAFDLQVSQFAVHLNIDYNQTTLDRVSRRSDGFKYKMTEFAHLTTDMDDSIRWASTNRVLSHRNRRLTNNGGFVS
ncbi:MAG: hypothetical protein O3B13_03440 [Planctomycetota bacterium]|nr:hypothetical protein [Planctomycetota bacterium]MDA1162134.1 hypothetical protein [Planctomycetota bacterium]